MRREGREGQTKRTARWTERLILISVLLVTRTDLGTESKRPPEVLTRLKLFKWQLHGRKRGYIKTEETECVCGGVPVQLKKI